MHAHQKSELKYMNVDVSLYSAFSFLSLLNFFSQLRIEQHLPHQHLYISRRTSAVKFQYHRQTLSEKHRRPFAAIILIVDRFAKVIKVREVSKVSRVRSVRKRNQFSVQVSRVSTEIDRLIRSRQRTARARLSAT